VARLLLVDDDRDVLTVLRTGLQARGHETFAFSDSEEARRWLETRSPDAVLLDVRMPAVSGWDLLGDIRGSRRSARLPVIMLSANGDVDERVRGLRLGADDFCIKPFHVEEVIARVEGLIARSRSERAGIRGDLSTFALADVLQSIEQQRLTGTLEIDSGRAHAGYRRGRCHEAACDALDGVEALHEMLALASGTFHFVDAGDAALDDTGGSDPGPWLPRASELLLERAWIEDELQARRARLPDGDATILPGAVALESAVPRELPRLPLAALVRAADEPSGVRRAELARRLRSATARVDLALAVLLEAGVVRTAATPPPGRDASPRSEAARRELESLRASLPHVVAAALVDVATATTLAAFGDAAEPDPAGLARLDGAIAMAGFPWSPHSRFEEALFTFEDRRHLLRDAGDRRLLAVIAERAGSNDEVRLRVAVQQIFPIAGRGGS
jgi:DNA-binding response OmpR family regulator